MNIFVFSFNKINMSLVNFSNILTHFKSTNPTKGNSASAGHIPYTHHIGVLSGDIGGAMGFFIGGSVMSIAEVLDALAQYWLNTFYLR